MAKAKHVEEPDTEEAPPGITPVRPHRDARADDERDAPIPPHDLMPAGDPGERGHTFRDMADQLRPKYEPAVGTVGVAASPAPDVEKDPNAGLRRIKSQADAIQLMRSGHRIRFKNMDKGDFVAMKREANGEYVVVRPVTSALEADMFPSDQEIYLLPD